MAREFKDGVWRYDDDNRPMGDDPDLRDVLKRLERRVRQEWPGLARRVREALPGQMGSLAQLADHPALEMARALTERAEHYRDARDDLRDQLRQARETIARLLSVEGLAESIAQLDDEEVRALADRVGRLDARASVGDDRESRP